jgi:myosin heavy subunit
MKDLKSVLIVLLSTGLIGTWVYHIYDKTIYSNRRTEVYIKDSAAVADAIRDSLQKLYAGTIRDLDSQLDSTRSNADSLQNNLETKLSEINVLRKEIGGILKNRNATTSDLSLARSKINDLQEKMKELRDQNTSMEEEKKRLAGVLEQLSTEMKSLEQNIRKLDQENKEMSEKIYLASSFVVSELNFHVADVRGSKEQATTQARRADKFVSTFTLQNNIADYETTEVFIIITDPAGQVVQNPIYSGTFASKNEGVKNFTRKIRFEYAKGEAKKLVFSLDADKYEKGNYKMDIYHNGIQIAKTSYSLK